MRKLLLATTALLALSGAANADIVRTLGGLDWTIGAGATILGFSTAQPPGNQPQNNPCIICGANQPNQTNQALGFGYTDYGNQGNQTSETYFSSGTLQDKTLAPDTISLVNYSGVQLKAAVATIDGGTGTGFNIGLDMNDTGKAQTLESFFFLDLTAHQILAAFSPDILDGKDLIAAHNGTGFPDFELTGLSTANLIDGHQYAFFARMSNINDGPDSFFLTAGAPVAAVPEASTWMMMIAGFFGLGGLAMRKRNERQFRVA